MRHQPPRSIPWLDAKRFHKRANHVHQSHLAPCPILHHHLGPPGDPPVHPGIRAERKVRAKLFQHFQTWLFRHVVLDVANFVVARYLPLSPPCHNKSCYGSKPGWGGATEGRRTWQPPDSLACELYGFKVSESHVSKSRHRKTEAKLLLAGTHMRRTSPGSVVKASYFIYGGIPCR